ncbi:hypothetical protein A2U01_0018152, partial [Trifolium medium]|nr:hypothetical protein [Trifolium medium]
DISTFAKMKTRQDAMVDAIHVDSLVDVMDPLISSAVNDVSPSSAVGGADKEALVVSGARQIAGVFFAACIFDLFESQ